MLLAIFWTAVLEGMLDVMVDAYWQYEYDRVVAMSTP